MELELSPLQRKISYALLAVLWPMMLYNFAFPYQVAWLQQALYWTGIAIIVTHAVEVFLFLPKLPASTNKLLGIVMIFFFGIVYASGFPKTPGK